MQDTSQSNSNSQSAISNPQFLDEPIQVEYDPKGFLPKAFVWRGERFEIAEVMNVRQEWGTPKHERHIRTWWQRRHRNYYTVRVANGDVFEIYLDRGSGRRDWILLKRNKEA